MNRSFAVKSVYQHIVAGVSSAWRRTVTDACRLSCTLSVCRCLLGAAGHGESGAECHPADKQCTQSVLSQKLHIRRLRWGCWVPSTSACCMWAINFIISCHVTDYCVEHWGLFFPVQCKWSGTREWLDTLSPTLPLLVFSTYCEPVHLHYLPSDFLYPFSYYFHVLRVTTCMENLEMSGNLTAAKEMSGILIKVREVSGKKSYQEKVA